MLAQTRRDLLGKERDPSAGHVRVLANEILEVAAPALDDRWLICIPVLLPLPTGRTALLTLTARLQQVRDQLRPILRVPLQQR